MEYGPNAHLITRLVAARVLRNDAVDNIPPEEVSKKVNYILNLNIDEPLELNIHDLPIVVHALRNRLDGTTMFDDRSIRNRIHALGIDTQNRRIHRRPQPTSGTQGGRKRRTRKYKK
jgi:hypothetical protein